jgi:integrase
MRNGRVEWVGQLALNEWRTRTDGTQRRRYFFVVRHRQLDVQRALDEARAARDHGLPVDERQLVSEFLDYWLRNRVSVRPGTLASYESTVRLHIEPLLGHYQLARLTVQHVDRMTSEVAKRGCSPALTRYALKVLRIALGDAERIGLVARNVARLARPPRVPKREIEPFDWPEIARLLTAIRGDRLEAYVIVTIALGLRLSEGLGLCWSDLDLDGRTLTIRHQLAYVAGEFRLQEPKSASGHRTVALPIFVAEALRAHRVRQLEEQLRAGAAWRNELDLVFTGQAGRPLHRRNVLRWFQNWLRREGLPVRGIKELRHTAASLLHAAGITDREIMAVLGHSDVRVTMNTYTHLFADQRRRAADRMDDLFLRSQT